MKMHIARINSAHQRKAFSCGKEALDFYIQNQARQEDKKDIAACFVLIDQDALVKGYYTLSSASIPRELVPADISRKLPRYKDLPVTLLGRLAVDKSISGQGYGEFVLMDALRRAVDVSIKSITSLAIVVDPIDTEAAEFYSKYGFIQLKGSSRMFLPMATVVKMFYQMG